MIKIAKKLLVMLIVSVFMISMVAATAHAVNTPSDEKIVEHKEKKIKNYKIKWSANGGKIGTKKTVTTTVKKGSKVKLAKTPKRAGYSFLGWFSKKSGGKKITKNAKPTKSVTYFAHWKKKDGTNNPRIDSKLVGNWERDIGWFDWYHFGKDGTFSSYRRIHSYQMASSASGANGKYTTAGGKVYLSNLKDQSGRKLKNQNLPYSFGNDKEGNYLSIPTFKYIYLDMDDTPSLGPVKFRKSK